MYLPERNCHFSAVLGVWCRGDVNETWRKLLTTSVIQIWSACSTRSWVSVQTANCRSSTWNLCVALETFFLSSSFRLKSESIGRTLHNREGMRANLLVIFQTCHNSIEYCYFCLYFVHFFLCANCVMNATENMKGNGKESFHCACAKSNVYFHEINYAWYCTNLAPYWK